MRNLSRLFSLLFLCALAPLPDAQAAGLSLSPAAITNDYAGKLTLTVTGLSAGQTVRVDRFNDINGNIHEYPRRFSRAVVQQPVTSSRKPIDLSELSL